MRIFNTINTEWLFFMEKHIEPRVVLQAADKIRQHGVQKQLEYILDGVSLLMSPDEYTIELRTPKVAFSLYFHNKFKADVKKQTDLDDFYRLIERIAATDYSG